MARKRGMPVAVRPSICPNGRRHKRQAWERIMARRRRLAERRKAVGLSQEGLAEAIGVDRSTVVRWERGDTQPQPWHRPRLAELLKVSVDELARLLTEENAVDTVDDDRLGHALEHPRSVDLVAIGHLREQIQRLDQRYEFVLSTSLLAPASQLHGQAVFLRQHATRPHLRRELWAAEMESALLMGQLVWDASQRRDHKTALDYFDQAVTAARHARDGATEANAMLRKSYVALYGTNDPQTGLALAQRAAEVGRGESHVIAGLALLHAAEASAMMSDRTECAHTLGAADDDFAQVDPDDPAAALFCPSQPGRLAGSCHLFLGQPAKAEPVLEAARLILDARKKATSIVLGNLAIAAIRQRRVDDAVSRLHQALDVIERTRSGGGLNVVFGAAQELRPWRNEPTVQQLDDRLLTLMTPT
jgi:transcriptional regulator with XRE-family HTH domain